jgi:hypothetical protein
MRPVLYRWALSAALVAALAEAVSGQAPAATPGNSLALTSSSETAKREFRLMLAEIFNLRPAKARVHGQSALAADPGFGLARINLMRATVSPELSAAVRLEEASKALATMSTATAPEILLGLYGREVIAGRAAAALPILRAAAAMVPGDPDVAYMLMTTERGGRSVAENVRLGQEFLAKYPDFGAAYNQHAYSLHASGDAAGALAAARKQAELLPDHPNAEDTWADILLLEGRVDEAYSHTQASLRLDSTYFNAHVKQGTIALVRGQYEQARASFKRGAEVAGTPAARVEASYWNAASYLYQHDVSAAMRELAAAAEGAAAGGLTPAQRALPYQRMAVIEAMLGDKSKVQSHLAKGAETGPANSLNQVSGATLAYAALGDSRRAAENARAYAQLPGANADLSRALAAAAALAAGDVAAAERDLGQSAPTDLLGKALRAEILKRKGRTAEARALRDEILRSAIKLNTNGPLDFAKLVGRLRAEKL